MRVFAPFFTLILLLYSGCYNNAHVRTQKMLGVGEKVYSGSGSLNLGGQDGTFGYTGVPGFRAELSLLKGTNFGEIGFWGGAGLLGESIINSYFGGGEVRKNLYLIDYSPFKLGFQGEFNFTPKSNYRGFGSSIQIRPSLISCTNKSDAFYGGIFGLFSLSSLKKEEYFYEWDTAFLETKESIPYTHNTVGIGLTSGFELFASKNSIQIQMDISYIKGFINPQSSHYLKHNYNGLIVTGSVGMNIFKPNGSGKVIRRTEYKTNQSRNLHPEKLQDTSKLIFDPESGKIIKPSKLGATDSSSVQFDPETGLPIEGEDNKEKQPMFDPETGKPISIMEK